MLSPWSRLCACWHIIQKPSNIQTLYYRWKKGLDKEITMMQSNIIEKVEFFVPHACVNTLSGFATNDVLFYFSLTQRGQIEA